MSRAIFVVSFVISFWLMTGALNYAMPEFKVDLNEEMYNRMTPEYVAQPSD